MNSIAILQCSMLSSLLYCFLGNVGFNEKPLREQRKDFTATYLGSIDVPKPTGKHTTFKGELKSFSTETIQGLSQHCFSDVI